jgi:hypothetical protein
MDANLSDALSGRLLLSGDLMTVMIAAQHTLPMTVM